MKEAENRALLTGRVGKNMSFYTAKTGEKVMRGILEVKRLSGYEDRIPFIARAQEVPGPGTRCTVEGRIETLIDEKDRWQKIKTRVRAERICAAGEEDENRVNITGTIKRVPVLRTTPKGVLVCDFAIQPDGMGGAAATFGLVQVIAWWNEAKYVSEHLTWGDRVKVAGRLQSRGYEKQMPDGTSQTKMVIELSADQVIEY